MQDPATDSPRGENQDREVARYRRRTIVLSIAVAVLCVAVIGLAASIALTDDDSSTASATSMVTTGAGSTTAPAISTTATDALPTSAPAASTTTLTPEQAQMVATVESYIAAWNSGEADAAAAVMYSDGYLEDVSGRWLIADGSHADYLRLFHSLGKQIYLEDPVIVENVLVALHRYSEGGPVSPNIYYMTRDGTQIYWVIEPFPPDLDLLG